ncbi:hypothetical protein CKAH01_14060 [Colletotrichum kahawae]|uniref:Uncharacterized protein n=1 Tax=Colletotrichum kahawae TaxID=34407 RepID=A0AAD9YND7_COLKA|nr:hypothetical protein CKAH01_14060 [Colletotrichum kahawae]
MLSHTLICFAANIAAVTQPALGSPTKEQLEPRQSGCTTNYRSWTATMTGTCSTSGGPAITCDQKTDRRRVSNVKLTIISSANLGNNKFKCDGSQIVSTHVALVSRCQLT